MWVTALVTGETSELVVTHTGAVPRLAVHTRASVVTRLSGPTGTRQTERAPELRATLGPEEAAPTDRPAAGQLQLTAPHRDLVRAVLSPEGGLCVGTSVSSSAGSAESVGLYQVLRLTEASPLLCFRC